MEGGISWLKPVLASLVPCVAGKFLQARPTELLAVEALMLIYIPASSSGSTYFAFKKINAFGIKKDEFLPRGKICKKHISTGM